MDIQHLKAELRHHSMEWNELGNHFDRTEEKILDCLRSGEKDNSLVHFKLLKDIENKMRPLRNNLIFLYENLAQSSNDRGHFSEENDFYRKAKTFQKSRYTRNERSIRITNLLNRNGLVV